MKSEDEIWNAAIGAAIDMANRLGADRPRVEAGRAYDRHQHLDAAIRAMHVRARTIAAGLRLLLRPTTLDQRPDGSGLDDGPYLPGRAPRQKPPAKSRAELATIRARAWETRRRRYGKRGHA